MNKELQKLYLWLNINRLSLNVTKTNFIIFQPYNKPLKQHITLKINNKAIMEKNNIKYQGVIIDSHLNWKNHMLMVSKKISRCIGIMCKLRQFMNTSMLKNIHYSLLYSHMVYAIQVWRSACISEINKILVLQKRALRIITHKDIFPSVPGPLHPTDPLFYKLEVLKVQDVFKLQVSNFIFNCLQLNTPTIFHNWFRLNYTIHNGNTRWGSFDMDNGVGSNGGVIMGAKTTHYGLKGLKVSGPKIWRAHSKSYA